LLLFTLMGDDFLQNAMPVKSWVPYLIFVLYSIRAVKK
jgi:hypothetical protein